MFSFTSYNCPQEVINLSLNDAKFLLTDANEQLEIIKRFYQESIDQQDISPVLRLKIKHFLEDIRSSFDYTAFSIFNTYCKNNIKMKLEDHIKQVYFPVKFTEKKFNTFVSSIFPGLENSNPKIIEIFLSLQPFKGNAVWFKNLNELVNKNKHRYLTPQTRKTEVKQLPTFEFSGCTFVGLKTHVSYFGQDINFQEGIPVNASITGTETWVDFLFSELNLSVLPTLHNIYNSANNIINDLETTIEEK